MAYSQTRDVVLSLIDELAADPPADAKLLAACKALVQWNDEAGDAPEMLWDCVEWARAAIGACHE
jgi:hypothetical protein